MQDLIPRLLHSATIKVFAIGFLILVLLIPLAMIRDVIHERDQTGQSARLEVRRTWGNAQLVAGPVLVIPYDLVRTVNRGDDFVSRNYLYLLPESVNIDAAIDAEIRYRGIHNVPVYSARIRLDGSFSDLWLAELGIPEEQVDWQGVFVALGVSDSHAITETPSLDMDGEELRFVSGGNQVAGLPAQIIAPIGKKLSAEQLRSGSPFQINLHINGSESLRLLPSGNTTNVSMRSNWPTPSFSGNYLPEARDISESGFGATWRVSSIGRTLPSHWTDASGMAGSANESAFGVDLYMPIVVYRLTERATKYGVLFVGLTFVAYFLFEVIAGLRLHPLQYLLVGFANCLFYLLLLSLAEHIAFGWSYMISCTASCALVIGYSSSVLRDRRRSLVIAFVLALLYSFLYMTLKAENYAMLVGAIGLWTALGATMYLTRHVDWYGMTDPPS